MSNLLTILKGLKGKLLMNLLQKTLTNEQYNYTRIINNGEILLRLINDVLSITKIEAGKLSIIEENFNPVLF